jgi:uncharacterized protein YdiU (UPF0061 family)
MAVNTSSEPVHDDDSMKQYMEEKFSELIQKVGEGYGKPLQDELIRRLEKTIADFNEDVTELLQDLQHRSEKRYAAMKKIWSEGEQVSQEEEIPAETDEEQEKELSEWERRLEEKAKMTGHSKSDIDKKKHGRFSLRRK